ncbi:MULTISPECIES: SGNH/GDSL hydrolase family protein [unclassified Sporolactobacillus]|uniref:SGNH/GDSL hydrolase family protein n=1 Tax=unclassified Sporolactobacillus TaxID=2628533 RepID=UPI002368955F|nr:SGNH/GDSL hydrolase family protein [Sporolactobacillus sp. CQH2019]MDD9149536.1 SGNH/GDSL hydrolase family protein [Sporolactobacillus sp. CQH2019]
MVVLLALISIGSYGIYRYTGQRTAPQHKKTQMLSYRITALGDSLTQGVGSGTSNGYVGLAAASLKSQKNVKSVSFKDFGHIGDTSGDLLKVLKRPDVKENIRQSNTIFLTIGGNDLVRVLRDHFMDLQTRDFLARQKTFSANLNEIFTEIRQLNPSAPIFFFGLYNPFESYLGSANRDFVPILNQWNNNSRTIAGKFHRIFFIPTFDIFHGKGQSLLYEDHFHPNKEGYIKLSSRLLQFMKKDS